MNEYKKLYSPERFDCFRSLVYRAGEKYRRATAFVIKEGGGYRNVSFESWREQYITLCCSMLHMGLEGQRIAVCGQNSYGWVLSYLAAATVGVAVPIDRELFGEDISSFMKSADCKALYCDDKTEEKLNGFSAPSIRFSLKAIEGIATGYSKEERARLDAIEYPHDQLRVLIFTSGTTGNSKGVCLSQHNICTNIYQTSRIVKVTAADRTLSILPLHHTYECTLNCLLVLSRGGTVTYCDGLTKVAQNAVEYSPTILVVVPALLSMMSKRICRSVASSVPEKYKALWKGGSLAEAMAGMPLYMRPLIRHKIRKSLGGKLRMFIVGAAELDTSLVADFAALGIKTLQGYGLTECSPLLAGNSDMFFDPCTTGRAIPGVELKISEPNAEGVGEILAKGENIMLGYFEDKEATDRVMAGGYFHTGDLGHIDENGALTIRGRIKNVIVTGNGKNIYPEELETIMQSDEIFSEILVLAGKDDKGETCVKAKILPNLDTLKQLLGHVPTLDEIQLCIKRAIDKLNRKLPEYKRIKIFEILEKGLERTTTQKIKRFGDNMI